MELEKVIKFIGTVLLAIILCGVLVLTPCSYIFGWDVLIQIALTVASLGELMSLVVIIWCNVE